MANFGAIAATLLAIATPSAGRAADPGSMSGFYPPLPMAAPVADSQRSLEKCLSPPASPSSTTNPAAPTSPASPVNPVRLVNAAGPVGAPAPGEAVAPPGQGFIGGLDIQSAVTRLSAVEQAPTPVEDPDELAWARAPAAPAPPEPNDKSAAGSAPPATLGPAEQAPVNPLSNAPPAVPGQNPNPAFDPNFPGDPGPLDDDTSIARGIRDFFSGRSFPTEGYPAYTLTASALVLHRSNAKSVPLVTDAVGGEQLVGADNLGFGMAAGPRLDLCMHFASGYNFEVVFFGIEGWHSQASLSSGANNLEVPIFAGDRFSHINASYSSRLFNEEINSKHAIWGPVNILSGFRAVELNENLNLAGTGLTTNGSGNLKTRNWLLGIQVGAEAILAQHGPWTVDTYVKGGVYINPSRLTTNQTGDVTLPSGSSDYAHEAFVGDTGLNLNCQLPRDWTATVGYQMLWIDRVALAPNQAATTPAVNVHGDVFLNGVQVGFVKPF